MVRMTTMLGGGRYSSSEVRTEIKTELKNLDPDKYLGTIGLAADKPANAVRPHFTAFPSTQEEGNWLSSVSETTIDGRTLSKRQEWMCVTAKTADKEAVWEEIQKGDPVLVYPTHQRCVGKLQRILDTTFVQTAPSNGAIFLSLRGPICEGVFNNSQTASKGTNNLTPLNDLVVNSVDMDFHLRVEFSSDNAGKRGAALRVYTYYPLSSNIYDTLLNRFNLDDQFANPGQAVTTWRPRITVPKVKPLDEAPLTYAVSVVAGTTSDTPVNIVFAEMTITAWR